LGASRRPDQVSRQRIDRGPDWCGGYPRSILTVNDKIPDDLKDRQSAGAAN
jgi:hypothetical protein